MNVQRRQSGDSLKPALIAVVGGSGSGKTWLCERLTRALAPNAVRLCLDDFYLDRSRLSPARRALLNFDHPRAIDWPALSKVLKRLGRGQAVRVPCYDFKTHSRLRKTATIKPRPIVFVEGLWLLRRPGIRRLFALSIFLECASNTRLRRRIARDQASRGRTRSSVKEQFRKSVEPMHARFVQPQARFADLTVKGNYRAGKFRALVGDLKLQIAALAL